MLVNNLIAGSIRRRARPHLPGLDNDLFKRSKLLTIRRNLAVSRTLRCSAENSYCDASQWAVRRDAEVLSTGRRRYSHKRNEEADPYRRYRQTNPEELWPELRLETERTRQHVNQDLRDRLVQEIQLAAATTSEAVPELGPTGLYAYAFSDVLSKGRRIYRRRHVLTGKEETVLDISFHKVRLGAMTLSVDETYVGYLVTPNQSANDTQAWIRHVASGKERRLPVKGHIASVEFGPIVNGRHTFFYTTANALGRPDSVYACTVENMVIGDSRLVYNNTDEAVMVDVQRTKGCHYVAIHATSKTSNEIRLASCSDKPPQLVRARQEGVQYHIDVGSADDVFLLANATDGSTSTGLTEELCVFESRVSELPITDTELAGSADVSDDYVVNDMELFRDFVAFYESSTLDGHQRIRFRSRKSDDEQRVVPLPNPNLKCATLSPGGNMYFEATSLRFSVESPTSRGTMYEYDTLKHKLHNLSSPMGEREDQQEPANSNYTQKRVLVASKDGTRVPLSLVYRNNVQPWHSQNNPWHGEADESAGRPTVLMGYGAYGESMNLCFDPTLTPLLNRGFVLAYAHTRGGGDLGRSWYHAGRLYEKERAVEDYLSCAEALVGHLQITNASMLTAKAFSAGAVIVGAAVNRKPSLFGTVVLTNPFLDVTNAMMEPSLALTEHEWEEWGNPLKDETAARAIAAYCPFANVKNRSYPRMLVVGTLDDENVPVWHPVSFALKVRNETTNGVELQLDKSQISSLVLEASSADMVFLHVEPKGGHHLHGRRLDVAALEAAFILENNGER